MILLVVAFFKKLFQLKTWKQGALSQLNKSYLVNQKKYDMTHTDIFWHYHRNQHTSAIKGKEVEVLVKRVHANLPHYYSNHEMARNAIHVRFLACYFCINYQK